ncbi:MAG: phosphatase PAP2 family protein [Bacteroidota bacterium]
MRHFIKQHFIYIGLYLFLFIFLGYVLLTINKFDIHRYINNHVTNDFIGSLFSYLTHIGDGVFAIVLVLVLLFFSIRNAMYVLLSYAGASLVTTILKNFVFADYYRPYFMFKYYTNDKLNLVENVEILSKFSFPSGHATSAFAVFFCLLFMSKNHFLKIFYFSMACIAAFSRTYLSQHWLVDIYAGSLIGVSFSVIMYLWFFSNVKWAHLNITLQQFLSQRKAKRV